MTLLQLCIVTFIKKIPFCIEQVGSFLRPTKRLQARQSITRKNSSRPRRRVGTYSSRRGTVLHFVDVIHAEQKISREDVLQRIAVSPQCGFASAAWKWDNRRGRAGEDGGFWQRRYGAMIGRNPCGIIVSPLQGFSSEYDNISMRNRLQSLPCVKTSAIETVVLE